MVLEAFGARGASSGADVRAEPSSRLTVIRSRLNTSFVRPLSSLSGRGERQDIAAATPDVWPTS